VLAAGADVSELDAHLLACAAVVPAVADLLHDHRLVELRGEDVAV
jgi:hypothetical protein